MIFVLVNQLVSQVWIYTDGYSTETVQSWAMSATNEQGTWSASIRGSTWVPASRRAPECLHPEKHLGASIRGSTWVPASGGAPECLHPGEHLGWLFQGGYSSLVCITSEFTFGIFHRRIWTSAFQTWAEMVMRAFSIIFIWRLNKTRQTQKAKFLLRLSKWKMFICEECLLRICVSVE